MKAKALPYEVMDKFDELTALKQKLAEVDTLRDQINRELADKKERLVSFVNSSWDLFDLNPYTYSSDWTIVAGHYVFRYTDDYLEIFSCQKMEREEICEHFEISGDLTTR